MAERSSTWAFIVYPDSAPAEWKKLLKLSYISLAISPLHSPDPDGSGEERKKHYHVLLDFSSLKSEHQVENISKEINGTKPIIIQNPSGYYQYMIHKNDPDKEQFSLGFDAIERYNGFDSDKYEEFTKKQIDAFKKDIILIIQKNNINEYEALVMFFIDYCDVENFGIYFRLVTTNTLFFNAFLHSKRNRQQESKIEKLSRRIEKLESRLNNE